MAFFCTPRPAPRETFHSFVSRLAASKGVSTSDFCLDMGVSLKSMALLDDEAVAAVARWGDLTDMDMKELLSWTGVPCGNIRMTYRGEIFGSRALRNPVMRGCRKCLAENAADNARAPLQNMAMRGDWLFRDVTVCPKHKSFLTELWVEPTLSRRFDIGARLSELTDIFADVENARPELEPSEYHIWLRNRLEHGADATWLAPHSLYAATTTCGLLGSALIGLTPSALSDIRLRASALEAGFSALQPGIEAFRATLDGLVARADGAMAEPQKAFGPLYNRFSRDLACEEEFAPFRYVLRDCILSNWAYDRGEILLGEPVEKRSLHSVVSAAKELQITPALAEAILTDAGAFHPNDRRPYSRKVLSADDFEGLLAEIPTWVGPGEMMATMGATKRAFASLESDGVLKPRTRAPKVIARWRLQDGRELLERLTAISRPILSEETGWESLQQAKKRKGVPVGQIIDRVLSGRLALGKDESAFGYNGFRVRVSEVNTLAAELEATVSDAGALAGTISAAAFGRSVGMRDGGHFQALIAAGHSPSLQVMNPKTNMMQFRMTPDHIAAFHRKFLTTTTIEAEFGLHRNRIRAVLSAAGAQPFTIEGAPVGPVWLREEVERHLRGS